MEGEGNFLQLLPRAARAATAAHWYREARGDALDRMQSMDSGVESAVPYRSPDPQRELYALLAGRLHAALDQRGSLDRIREAVLRDELRQLTALRGAGLSLLPELSVLEIPDAAYGEQFFTLIRDTGHTNVSHLLREAGQLAPAENALTVVPGLWGLSECLLPCPDAGTRRISRRCGRVARGGRLRPPRRPVCRTAHRSPVLGAQRCGACGTGALSAAPTGAFSIIAGWRIAEPAASGHRFLNALRPVAAVLGHVEERRDDAAVVLGAGAAQEFLQGRRRWTRPAGRRGRSPAPRRHWPRRGCGRRASSPAP